MSNGPITFRYEGDGEFKSLPRFARECDERYVVGAYYRLADVEDRSTATHNHQFAWLAEAWQNLPETLKDLYPSPEHLRKRALIDAGFYDETALDCGSNAAALRVAAFCRARDDFALVIVRGPIVLHRTAKSQSRRAMKKDEFQASKTKIMEIVADMIGVSAAELERAAA